MLLYYRSVPIPRLRRPSAAVISRSRSGNSPQADRRGRHLLTATARQQEELQQAVAAYEDEQKEGCFGAQTMCETRIVQLLIRIGRLGEAAPARLDAPADPKIRQVLSTINEVLRHRGQCWTVCGAGGNRDKGKRPLMAQEAVRHSDRVIITSDNPRNEDPQEIINDMLAGLSEDERRHVLSIVDRREAIRTACMMAQPGDVILVAGKGHEDYQIIQGVKHHFDDHEIIKEAFGI